jgi:hypothetical protein
MLLQSCLESQQANSPPCARCCYRSYTNPRCNSANACSITNDHTSPSGLADDVRREHTNTDNAAEENATHPTQAPDTATYFFGIDSLSPSQPDRVDDIC